MPFGRVPFRFFQVSPEKNVFLDDLPLCPTSPPLKSENFIFIVVSPSLSLLLAYMSLQNDNNWAAANGGVTNGGLRGVWPPFLEIGRNRPFSPFFCLFRPFLEGAKSTWEIQKTEEKGLFPQISSDLLKPLFAALQNNIYVAPIRAFLCTGVSPINGH